MELLAIQNVLLGGNYNFSPLRIQLDMKSLTDTKSNGPKIVLEPEPADVLVIGGLGALLIKELKKSEYFK